MKRFLILMMTLALLALPAAAGEDYIMDEAGLLSARQEEKLEEKAAQIAEEYDCGVYIITVADFGSGSVRSYAEGLYVRRDLGRGEERRGILLLLSMEQRDYALISHNLDALAGNGLGLVGKLLLVILVPCGVAGVVCLVLAMQLRSVRRQTSARAYISGQGLQVTSREDFFVNRTVRRQRIQRSSSGGGGFKGTSGKF